MANLTLKRFAAKIGVSVGTVSAALNNRSSVKPQTAEYVNRKARELGYTVNPWARKMQDRRSGFFTLTMRNNPTNFANTLSRKIATALRAAGFTVTIQYVTDGETIDLYHSPADGYIVISKPVEGLLLQLDRESFPHLLVDPRDSAPNPLEHAEIRLDRRAAGEAAARVLRDAGCRGLGYFGEVGSVKLEGFMTGAEAAGYTAGAVEVFEVDGRSPDSVAPDETNRLTEMAPIGLWVDSLRNMLKVERICDRTGLQIGNDVRVLYWGASFPELPGFERYSYIGEPDATFFDALLRWTENPAGAPIESVTVALRPVLRQSLGYGEEAGELAQWR